MKRTCQQCGQTLRGRIDKIFCTDHCRSSHHNKLPNIDLLYIRKINRALKKNWKILYGIRTSGMKKIHRSKLAQLGFDAQLCTSMYTSKKKKVYYFCYDEGYLELDNGYCFLVKRKEEQITI